jgi:hypothetical protein
MAASLRRGRITVAGALIVLVVLWLPFAAFQVVQVLAESTFQTVTTALAVCFFPFFVLGVWRGRPSVIWARWALVGIYDVLALMFAVFAVLIAVNQGPFSHNPIPEVPFVMLEAIFAVPAIVFGVVGSVVTFSPSVRAFWDYRRGTPR